MPQLVMYSATKTNHRNRAIHFIMDDSVVFTDCLPNINGVLVLLRDSTQKKSGLVGGIAIKETSCDNTPLIPNEEILIKRGWRNLSQTYSGSCCFSTTMVIVPFFVFSSKNIIEIIEQLEWLGNIGNIRTRMSLEIVEYIKTGQNLVVERIRGSHEFYPNARTLYTTQTTDLQRQISQESQEFNLTVLLPHIADRVILHLQKIEKLPHSQGIWDRLRNQVIEEVQDFPPILTVKETSIPGVTIEPSEEEIGEVVYAISEPLVTEIKLYITEAGAVSNGIIRNAAAQWIRKNKVDGEKDKRMQYAELQHSSIFSAANSNKTSVGERIATEAAKSAAKEATKQVFDIVLSPLG